MKPLYKSIPKLAETNKAQSKEIASDLSRAIIYLQLYAEDDNQYVEEALVALTTQSPENYAPELSRLFYLENVTHDKRHILLSALSKAVTKLNISEGKTFQSRFYPIAGSFLFPFLKVKFIFLSRKLKVNEKIKTDVTAIEVLKATTNENEKKIVLEKLRA